MVNSNPRIDKKSFTKKQPDLINQKVGVVVVSYNASLAVRITLASLSFAKNKVPFELLLIDNASEINERNKIKTAFDHHRNKFGYSWKYIPLNENIGFPRGNNIGIKEFLKNETITHICLLNSDVLVTDYWLDRLINKNFDITSPVTNRSDSAQIVPVDYSIELVSCFNKNQEKIRSRPYNIIKKYSEKRHRAWLGNAISVDHVTFFCALISRETINEVGLLDEHFFPGGYEDNDYCIRAKDKNKTIGLIRDNFIHHWGSASFGKLQTDYFNEHALKNRRYFEQKHDLSWKPQPEIPFVSFSFDAMYAIKEGQGGDQKAQSDLLILYEKKLSEIVVNKINEFKNLKLKIEREKNETFQEFQSTFSNIEENTITEQFTRIFTEIDEILESRPVNSTINKKLSNNLDNFINRIQKLSTIILEMRQILGFQTEPPKHAQVFSYKRNPRSYLNLLRKGLEYYFNLDGMVIFGGYPYKFRENDGYFQRIKAIDKILKDFQRIYMDIVYMPDRSFYFDRPEIDVVVINFIGSKIRKLIAIFLTALLILRTRTIYFHSILALRRFRLLYYLPFITKIIDVHGVVPEEFQYHNDNDNYHLFNKIESLAIRKSDYIIVVTNAMRQHIQKKYGNLSPDKFIVLPILQSDLVQNKNTRYVSENPIIIYAGGLQKWQQVPKMINAMRKTYDTYSYKFFCPNPDEFRKLLPPEMLDLGSIEIGRKTKTELIKEYQKSNYGLILREDIVVNNVACPTKLVEYLAMGIIPIVDNEKIGDFIDLGMEYVTLNQLIKKNLPDENTWIEMVETNFSVFKSLKNQFMLGRKELVSLFSYRDKIK